jgi:hypothetical protein
MVQMRFSKIDVCPSRPGNFSRAGHGVQLPFDQAVGDAFDTGVGSSQHEVG